jgi:Tfp pilus assembly protein PilF
MAILSRIVHKILSRKLFVAIVLAIIAIAVYAPTARFQFVGLDEDDHITNRQHFLHAASSIYQVFTHDAYFPTGFSPHYRPLLTLSFMADTVVADARPLGYHITNIALHALAVVLLFFVLCEFGLSNGAALVWTSLFAVHPALRQIVAWVPGRNDSLLALFLLASFLFFMRFMRSGWWVYGMVSTFFFILGLFTKETALAFPLVCFAYAFFIKENFYWKHIIKPAIVGGVVVAGWLLARSYALSYISMPETGHMLQNMLAYIPSLLRYIRVAFVPFGLSVMPVIKTYDIWLGASIVVVMAGSIAMWGRHAWRRITFGLIWFFAFLTPTLISSETVTRMAFFEYRLYLPIMGLCFALSALPWSRIFPRSALRIIFVTVGIVLAGTTMSTSYDMRDPLSFWQSAVRTSPNLARAHDGLGVVYALRGMLDEALQEHLKAKELAPEDKRISNNVGVIYLRKNMLDKAQAAFKDEIALNATYAVAHHNLALAYAMQKRWADAEKEWVIAVGLNPWYVLPHQGLAIIYAQFGKIEQSVAHIKRIQELGAPLIPELARVLEWYETHQQK